MNKLAQTKTPHPQQISSYKQMLWLTAFLGWLKAMAEILGQHLQCEKTSAWICEDVCSCSAACTSLSLLRFPCVCGVISCPWFCLLSSCVTFKFTRISEKQHSSHQRALQLPSHSHSLIHTETDKSSGTACFLSFLNTPALSVLWSSAQ